MLKRPTKYTDGQLAIIIKTCATPYHTVFPHIDLHWLLIFPISFSPYILHMVTDIMSQTVNVYQVGYQLRLLGGIYPTVVV